MSSVVVNADCREHMAKMDAESVDAVVCDPPYGLEFMGKEWDRLDAGLPQENVWKGRRGKGGSNVGTDDTKPASRHHVSFGGSTRAQFKRCTICGKRQFSGTPCKCENPEWVIEHVEGPPSSSIRMQRWHESWAVEAYRVLKPGGHLLAFGGTRTSHRLASAIEDAGFEIRDSLVWLYGSGFPKSLDVGKAMDKVKDRSRLAALSAEIKRARAASGMTLAQIGEAMQAATDGQYGAWYHRGGHMFFETGMALPSRPEWDRLRHVLPIADEFGNVYDAAEREVVGKSAHRSGISNATEGHYTVGGTKAEHYDITAPATDLARQWDGWGTALKPAHEPIVVARKPLIGTVAANVARYGTGGINVDGCRIGTGKDVPASPNGTTGTNGIYGTGWNALQERSGMNPAVGRWPANVLLSHHPACVPVGVRRVRAGVWGAKQNTQPGQGGVTMGNGWNGTPSTDPGVADPDGTEQVEAWDCHPSCPVAALDAQSGERTSPKPYTRRADGSKMFDGGWSQWTPAENNYGDTGGASRFFATFPGELPIDDLAFPALYSPKASRRERNAGLDGMPEITPAELTGRKDGSPGLVMDGGKANPYAGPTGAARQNHHPTVKPVALLRWLVRLVTPPGGVVLDPFCGSGSMGMAAHLEGFAYVGIEQDAEYVAIAERRIAHVERHGERWMEAARAADRGPKRITSFAHGDRECAVCGSRTNGSGRGGDWPECGHGDWSWVPKRTDAPVAPPDAPGRAEPEPQAFRLSDLPLFAAVADDRAEPSPDPAFIRRRDELAHEEALSEVDWSSVHDGSLGALLAKAGD